MQEKAKQKHYPRKNIIISSNISPKRAIQSVTSQSISLRVRQDFASEPFAGLLLSDVLDESGKVKEVVILRKSITKGSKTVTAFFSHQDLREALSAYLKVRRGRSPYLFVNQKNQAFTPNSLSITMLRHYRKAGLEGASSHSGRRQYASALLKSGVDIVALSKLMGHSSIITTQQYVHHDDSELLKYVANAS